MPKVTLRNKKLYYQDIGSGHPILFAHSYLWDSHMWKPQIERLSRYYRCIVPDLWGHGQSDDLQLSSYCTIPEMANDYYDLMKHLGLKKFAMVGLSVGGMIAVELALKYKDALSCLAIIGSYVGPEPEIMRDKYFSLLDQIERNKKFTAELADMLAPLFFSPTTVKTDPNLLKAFNIHLRSIPSERIKELSRIGRTIFSRPDRLPELKKINVPTMIMVGEDDVPRPPREALRMAELLPDSSLVMFSQAGHICNLEQPDEVTHEIEKLIRGTIQTEDPNLKLAG